MNPTIPIEQRLLEAIRILAPEKQQAVLDFAEFLQHRQPIGQPINATVQQGNESTSKPVSKEPINLAERGISTEQAAELRWRFQAIAEDWNRPEMDIYDEL